MLNRIALSPRVSQPPQLCWYFGNLIFGGLIGLLIVDPLTGGMWTISPAKQNVQLIQTQTGMTPGTHGLIVLLKGQIPEDLYPDLIPLRPAAN